MLLVSDGSPALVYVLAYPLNIWVLEILMGYFCMWMYGRNVAWSYQTPDSLFHGNIRILYAPYWVAIGALVYFSLLIGMPALEVAFGSTSTNLVS